METFSGLVSVIGLTCRRGRSCGLTSLFGTFFRAMAGLVGILSVLLLCLTILARVLMLRAAGVTRGLCTI